MFDDCCGWPVGSGAGRQGRGDRGPAPSGDGAAAAGPPPPPARLSPSDRMVLAVWPGATRYRWPVFLVTVTPGTLLRWHREIWRLAGERIHTQASVGAWTSRWSRWCCGWRERTRGGDVRIVGVCRKLGLAVSATTVRRMLRRHRLGPAPPACRVELGAVPACAGRRGRWRWTSSRWRPVRLRRLYVLFVVEVGAAPGAPGRNHRPPDRRLGSAYVGSNPTPATTCGNAA
jgi:hypothetical protein